ncbi:MAG: hypothetical protein AB7S68_21855, partial [Polyangiaceae bacterium]
LVATRVRQGKAPFCSLPLRLLRKRELQSARTVVFRRATSGRHRMKHHSVTLMQSPPHSTFASCRDL